MFFLCFKLIVYISCITFVHSIIIFNHDKFIIDTPFENIKNAVTSGNMKCGLENEDLKLHQNKYNGTHIIFSYRQLCDIRSKKKYAKKEEIYFNEFMNCNLKYVTNREHTTVNFFEFNDTCSIEYDKACEGKFIGPCIPTPDNSTTSTITIDIGMDTLRFTTEEIQSEIQHDVICDPTRIREEIDTNRRSDNPYELFSYGRQTCLLKLQIVIPDGQKIIGGFEVAARFGLKVNKEPVKKSEKFNK